MSLTPRLADGGVGCVIRLALCAEGAQVHFKASALRMSSDMVSLAKSEQLDQKVLDSCAVVHQTWNEITRTWTLPTIHMLGQIEPTRFNELKRHIVGISATSLAERLSQLEKFGVVQRKVYAEEKPKIEYSLTVKGHEIYKILLELASWSKRWAGKEPNSREFLVPT
jgi:DNA-binding HxlR family transcriptional regulator